MNSTGNDIVSLNTINITRTKQQRFYSKILGAAENAAYTLHKADIPFENFVWLSWSIKESAYKFLKRNNPDLVFSPTRCIVNQLEIPADYQVNDKSIAVWEGTGFDSQPIFKGMVTVGPEMLYSRSIISRDFIFSVVSRDDDFENTGWGIKLIDDSSSDNQSAEVRAFLLEKLKNIFSSGNLQVTKNAHGCPGLVTGENEIPVSMAHHEHWVAYSYQLDSVVA